MNEIQLKPCPYCGSTKAFLDDERTIEFNAARVYCPSCHAGTMEYKPHHAAVDAWNAGMAFHGNIYEVMCAGTVIVSRHAGTVEWLKQRGIRGTVIPHVTDPAQIAGKIVFGAVPLHLAAQAAAVVSIDMPDLPAEARGQDLTPEQMDEYGARMSVYRVTRG